MSELLKEKARLEKLITLLPDSCIENTYENELEVVYKGNTLITFIDSVKLTDDQIIMRIKLEVKAFVKLVVKETSQFLSNK